MSARQNADTNLTHADNRVAIAAGNFVPVASACDRCDIVSVPV